MKRIFLYVDVNMKIFLLVLVMLLSLMAGCEKSDIATATVTTTVPSQEVTIPSQLDTTEAVQTESTLQETTAAPLPEGPIVYMTTEISPEALVSIYQALGRDVTGNVGIKVSFGEPGGEYYLSPDLVKDLVLLVDGTFVDSNTAYGGLRASTSMHLQAAEDHGFTEYAPVDILDADGSISLPIANGVHLTEDLVGSHYADYDSFIVLSHFKGHMMGGFGGAIKNSSIGFASASGKCLIHSAGQSTTSISGGAQNDFLESMAEAAKAIADDQGESIIYISVMNNLSVDCDCDASPAKPEMADIGILASLDPVALDQACVDLVYAAPDGAALIERIESKNGLLTLEHAEEIGLGSRTYTLVSIDD
jgi:uncharacterized Fe-S center protein